MGGQNGLVANQAGATKNLVLEDIVRCILRRWKVATAVGRPPWLVCCSSFCWENSRSI